MKLHRYNNENHNEIPYNNEITKNVPRYNNEIPNESAQG